MSLLPRSAPARRRPVILLLSLKCPAKYIVRPQTRGLSNPHNGGAAIRTHNDKVSCPLAHCTWLCSVHSKVAHAPAPLTLCQFGQRERPDAHTQRYDRQLRLWASSGQASLESGSVLLIGCTPTGCAILKNLVLPGLGNFTILDPRRVTAADQGANFFLDPSPDKVGSAYRAEEAVRLLGELNPSVKGQAKVEDVRKLLKDDPSFFAGFSIIIASEQPQDVLLPLSEICWDPSSVASSSSSSSSSTANSIPLLHVRTSGLTATTSFQIKELGSELK